MPCRDDCAGSSSALNSAKTVKRGKENTGSYPKPSDSRGASRISPSTFFQRPQRAHSELQQSRKRKTRFGWRLEPLHFEKQLGNFLPRCWLLAQRTEPKTRPALHPARAPPILNHRRTRCHRSGANNKTLSPRRFPQKSAPIPQIPRVSRSPTKVPTANSCRSFPQAPETLSVFPRSPKPDRVAAPPSCQSWIAVRSARDRFHQTMFIVCGPGILRAAPCAVLRSSGEYRWRPGPADPAFQSH